MPLRRSRRGLASHCVWMEVFLPLLLAGCCVSFRVDRLGNVDLPNQNAFQRNLDANPKLWRGVGCP
jgi:hypothetical protein